VIRTIITPKDKTISFDIPKKYIGKQIEVIAFSTDEEMVDEDSVQKKVSFTALAMDTRNYKFNRDEANER